MLISKIYYIWYKFEAFQIISLIHVHEFRCRRCFCADLLHSVTQLAEGYINQRAVIAFINSLPETRFYRHLFVHFKTTFQAMYENLLAFIWSLIFIESHRETMFLSRKSGYERTVSSRRENCRFSLSCIRSMPLKAISFKSINTHFQ